MSFSFAQKVRTKRWKTSAALRSRRNAPPPAWVAGWEVKPVTGDQLEVIAKEVVDQPPDIVEWLKKLLDK